MKFNYFLYISIFVRKSKNFNDFKWLWEIKLIFYIEFVSI